MQPYVIDHLDGLKFRVGTEEAREWYDPMKPYTELEYRWVFENISLKKKNILDCGAHHGHYSILFGKRGFVIAVEPYYHNVTMIEKNIVLNGLENKCDIHYGAVAKSAGMRPFVNASNGRLADGAGTTVECMTMRQIMPNAQIVKIDIEGGEFEILPEQIDSLPECEVWIIEIHPQFGDPETIAAGFKDWELLKVNREKMTVEPYQHDKWQTHATLIARKCHVV